MCAIPGNKASGTFSPTQEEGGILKEKSCYNCRLAYICKHYAKINAAIISLPKHNDSIKPLCTTVINAMGQHCTRYEKENDDEK